MKSGGKVSKSVETNPFYVEEVASPSSSIYNDILLHLDRMENIDKNVTQKRRFHCKQCDKSFTVKQSLKRHIMTEHIGLKVPCPKCDEKFKQKVHMKRHLLIKHGNAGKWVCDSYKCDFNEENGTVSYLRCKLQFKRSEALKRHKEVNHEIGNQYECKICDKNFSYKHSLIEHSNIHKGKKPHKCNHCGKCFRQKSHLATHLKSIKKQV